MTKPSLVAMLAAGSLVGCGSSGDDVPSGPEPQPACHVAAADPGFDATGVFVRQPLMVQWSEPVDGSTIASELEVKELGGETVPVTVQQTAPDRVLVHPQQSFWFWGEYAVVVGDGVATESGDPCSREEIAFSTLEPGALPRPLKPAGAAGIAKIGDHVITASSSYRGLQVYDVTNPAAVELVGEVPTEQSPNGLTVAGDRAYAPAGVEGVLIFDVSSPSHPVQIGRAGTPGSAMHVDAFEKNGKLYLAVADFKEGVRLLDVTDAAGPKDLGFVDPTGKNTPHSRGVDVQGDLLAIAEGVGNGVGWLALVDIADPEKPVVLSHTQDDYDLFDVVLVGDVAYTSRGPLGVKAWNIVNPVAPVGVTTVPGPSTTMLDNLQRLVVDGGELFAATWTVGVQRVALDGIGGMVTTAVQDVPGQATSVAVDGTHIYAGGEAGLLVYERAAPSGAAPTWFDPDGHGMARGVAVVDGHAYVAAGSRGLQTFSLAASSAPELVDRDDTPGMALDVAAASVITSSDLVILGDARGGIGLYDRTNPADPTPVGVIDSIDAIAGMQLVGTTLFACETNEGMLIADIASPSAPIVLSTADIPPDRIACLDLVIIGDVALLGANHGLGIVDVSDPSTPEWLGWAEMSKVGGISHIELVGEHLLASFRVQDYEGTYDVSNGLLVFDVSDPLAPRLVWESENLGGASQLSVADDIAFMAGGPRGVLVFDISDIESPQLEGAIPTLGNAIGLALGEQTLYVAQGNGGLATVPVGLLPPH